MSFQVHPVLPAIDGAYLGYARNYRFWKNPGPFLYNGAHYFFIPGGDPTVATGYAWGGGILKTTDAGSTWFALDPLTLIDWDLDLLDGRGQPAPFGSGSEMDVTRIGDAVYITWQLNQANDGYHLPMRVSQFDLSTETWTVYYGGTPPTGDGPEVACIYYDPFNQTPYYLIGAMAHCDADGKLAIVFNAENTPVYEALHLVSFDPDTATFGTVYTITTKSEPTYVLSCEYDPVDARVHVLYTTIAISGFDVTDPIYHAVIDPVTGTVDSDVTVDSGTNDLMYAYGARLVLGTEDGARKIAFTSYQDSTESITGTFGTRPKLKLWTYDIDTATWTGEEIPFPPAITDTHTPTVYSSSLTKQNSAGVGFYNDKVQVLLCTSEDNGDWADPQLAKIWRITRDGAGGWNHCLQHAEDASSKRKWFGPQFADDATLGAGFLAWSERYDTMTPDPHTQTVRWFSLLTCGRRRPEIDEA